MKACALLGLLAPASTSASVAVDAHAVMAPQDTGPRKPSAPPGGGTPEPMTLMLLAGGALGYGVLRMRRGKGDPKEK